jgi:hypothetical protein
MRRVRAVRSECLDWVLIWNERHLHRVLCTYLAHYNACPHRGLDLEVPITELAVTPSGVFDPEGQSNVGMSSAD